MSHIPIHPQSLERWKLNIHGHLHQNVVIGSEPKIDITYKPNGQIYHELFEDPKYRCVSMEHLDDYTPMLLETILGELI